MPDAPSIPASDPTPSRAADRLTDFSDRLSPMLVKELRQGLRARTFISVFLTLQILLSLILLSSLGATQAPQQAGQTVSSIIFMFFSIAVLVIQPLRGVGALHREIAGNTIELMVLTRLSAWKIVLGKWISIVAQSALLLATIIPYLILRYWFGDMNLFGELVLLFLVFLGSAVGTALTVGLSGIPSVIIRGLFPLAGGLITAIACINLSFGYGFRQLVEACSLQDGEDRWGVLIWVLAGSYLAWTVLGMGASMIAPAAENHSTRRRLITMATLIIGMVLVGFGKATVDLTALVALLITAPAIIMALSEPFHPLPSVYEPFVRKGAWGRLAGRFLYPGWPSGTIFSLLIVGLGLAMIGMVAIGAHRGAISDEEIAIFVSLIGTLLMPAAIVNLLGKRVKNRFSSYLLVLVCSLVLTIVLMLVAEAMPRDSRDFLWLFAWVPLLTLMMTEASGFDNTILATITTIVAMIYALIMGVTSLRAFRHMREVEDECRLSATPEPDPTLPTS